VGRFALRGAGAAASGSAGSEQPPREGPASSMALVGAAGALALQLPRGAARSRASAALRRAAAAAVVEAPAEEKAAPPPPPPFDPAKQLGVTDPLGYFDPLGFCKVGDEAGFRNLRSAEMKHGRVAMMAAVGAVAQAAFQFPGFEDVPKGLGAVFTPPGTYGFAALFLVSGALELTVWRDDPAKGPDSIGDFGNPLQLGLGAPLGESEDMRNRELNNGRAAMFAILGIIVAELATGKDALQQLG